MRSPEEMPRACPAQLSAWGHHYRLYLSPCCVRVVGPYEPAAEARSFPGGRNPDAHFVRKFDGDTGVTR